LRRRWIGTGIPLRSLRKLREEKVPLHILTKESLVGKDAKPSTLTEGGMEKGKEGSESERIGWMQCYRLGMA
jgi:hypothetical protein